VAYDAAGTKVTSAPFTVTVDKRGADDRGRVPTSGAIVRGTAVDLRETARRRGHAA
jgi:hypothetical protein